MAAKRDMEELEGTHQERIDEAVDRVAEAIGDLMEFWNFKNSMGKVWAILYLSREPLTADEIGRRTRLSSGSVSMTLNELRLWGVVGRSRETAGKGPRRRKTYVAETDILAMVTRVFRERELKQVRRVVRELEAAQVLLEQTPEGTDSRIQNRFVMTRMKKLLELARRGERIVERFAQAGEMDLSSIRNWLGRPR